jgi:L-cysteine S-thiosulfotransferase
MRLLQLARWLRVCLPMWVCTAALAAPPTSSTAPDPRRPGSDFMSPATQAMQRDDSANPAFLWVADGRRRFDAACARCHEAGSLRGVAARYPAWDERLARPLTLAGRIRQCQQRHVQGPELPFEGEALLGLEAFVALASRGQPIAPPADPRLDAARALGAQLYAQPFGQLRMSCGQCHDAQAGRRLGGSLIPQGHPTGYPTYRLEWQALGSLERRLRHCMSGVRAQPFDFGSAELVALQLHLAQRAAGMAVDSPAVRP